MCGISGWIDWRRDLRTQEDTIARMTGTLRHRGPDGMATWVSEHAALGHTRLAVIDIEGGRQPMLRAGRAGETAVLTFSGEIYNFVELRSELQSHGWSFTTRSDTEVILIGYLQWGAGVVTHLNGMYAFAVWDEHKRELLLARDRLGIKPLYYAAVGDGIVFGSEPKALLAHPQLPAEVDSTGLAELFAVPRARTPGHGVYAGMREVRPGSMVVGDANGWAERPYWSLEARPHHDGFDETSAEVGNRLRDIMRRQVVADVPVGTLLSGGLDSSLITVLAAGRLGDRLTSHSVRVPGAPDPNGDVWRPSDDEPYARLVAERLGLRRFVTQVDADALVSEMDRGLEARDLPGWGDLDVSMYLLFRGAREQCTVALSGEAGDEMFGGYAWQLDPRFVGHPSFPWMYGRRQPDDLLREDVRREVRPDQYREDRYHEALAEVPRLEGEDAARRREREVFYLGLTRWLSALLDRKDRMSMAVGLEVRVPFADHGLAEYLYDVPMAFKHHDGMEKGLLRDACAGVVPPEVVARTKSAYPATRDPRYVEMLRSLVLDLVAEPNRPVFDLLDRGAIRTAVTSGLETLPGPITATTPAIGLSYILELDRWLERYRVRLKS